MIKTPKTYDKFLACNDMLGIKQHVLKLENSVVASEKSFELNQNKTLKPWQALHSANLAILESELTYWV